MIKKFIQSLIMEEKGIIVLDKCELVKFEKNLFFQEVFFTRPFLNIIKNIARFPLLESFTIIYIKNMKNLCTTWQLICLI